MRKVIYSEYVYKFRPSRFKLQGEEKYGELQEKGEAFFHQFGLDYCEFEFGSGNYTTAIIELEDGTVKNLPVEHIKFIKD